MELTDERFGAGCAILPIDAKRHWAGVAWKQTEEFFNKYGWTVFEKIDSAHRYHLDDDPDLTSSAILVRRSCAAQISRLPFQGRQIDTNEMRDFYGRTVKPPFPRYVREDGSFDFDWSVPGRRIA